jgi:ribosomal protein L11 methyltransferase
VTPPLYTRYTLRLGAARAGEGEDARSAPTEAPAAPEADGRAPDAWVDDWSGAPPPPAPDPAALDYAHPGAVTLLRGLGLGWQEQDGGDTLVFWLPQGAEGEPEAAHALARLGTLGRLRAAAQTPGWEDAWQAFHKAQTVGRLFVRPPWTPPRDDLLDVVIDAGMAFGTGAHPTTRQCLEEIQSVPPGSLLDLGCGSGVVALAALRLGFGPVWGIDSDPVAVTGARGNADRNGLECAFSEGDATDAALPLPHADTVVANIALGPLVRLAPRFRAGPGEAAPALRPRRLILAGLLVAQRDEVLAAYPGFTAVAGRDDGEWLCLRLEPRP